MRLFVERRRRPPGFQLTDQNASAVARDLPSTRGHAARDRAGGGAGPGALAPSRSRERLDDRFGLLTGGSRTALPRQQTLRATIDWSHDLLSEPETVLFRRLAVFAGGWTLEAAEEVCVGGEVGRSDVLDLLSHLVDKSLVLVEPEPGEPRYRLLATIQEYARGRLEESGEIEAVRERHREHYLALAERASARLWVSNDQRVWIDSLEADHDNLRSALRSCQEADQSAFLRLASSLFKFWDTKGYTAEGRRWLEEALRAAPENTPSRAAALWGAGHVAADQGDHSSANAYWEEYLAFCREMGDRHWRGPGPHRACEQRPG